MTTDNPGYPQRGNLADLLTELRAYLVDKGDAEGLNLLWDAIDAWRATEET